MSNKRPFEERGRFIKQCRDRRTPSLVSRQARKRRVSGWTRKEVAERANISIDWYTKLEQGYSVSDAVLGSVMDALQMTSGERATVVALSKDVPVEESSIEDPGLSQALERYLDLHNHVPFYIMNQRWYVVAWNAIAESVLGDFSAISSKERNVVRMIFCNPNVRKLMGDVWERQARQLVREFRITYRTHRGDELLEQLVLEVSAKSTQFYEWWHADDGEIGGDVYSVKRLHHPELGELDFEQIGLVMNDAPHLRMVVHVPTNETTLNKLRRWNHNQQAPSFNGRSAEARNANPVFT